MSNSPSIRQLNEQLARQINEEACRNPQSAYVGKFVGLANGHVVAIADTLDEVAMRLEDSEPDPAKTFCLEAGLDYDEVQEIWGPI